MKSLDNNYFYLVILYKELKKEIKKDENNVLRDARVNISAEKD